MVSCCRRYAAPGVLLNGDCGLTPAATCCHRSAVGILLRFAASNHKGETQWRQSKGLAVTGSSSAATPRLRPVKSVAF